MSIQTEVIGLEQRFWQALKDRDAATAAELTDASCVLTGAQGAHQLPLEELKGMVANPPYAIESFELKNAQVKQVSDDVAVIAYQVREELLVDGKRVSLDAADASTWVKRDGKWKCVLHTESLAGDPFGRDRASAPRA